MVVLKLANLDMMNWTKVIQTCAEINIAAELLQQHNATATCGIYDALFANMHAFL
jgi:hypothetical protein